MTDYDSADFKVTCIIVAAKNKEQNELLDEPLDGINFRKRSTEHSKAIQLQNSVPRWTSNSTRMICSEIQ